MPSAFRAPRTLSNWLQLDYFRRRTLFRGWWGGLSLITAVVSLLWLGVMWRVKGNTVFQAGPLSHPHAMFNHDCKLCHQDNGATLARMWKGDTISSVPDSACTQCHTGAHHNPPHAELDRCVSCHREHRGHDALVRVADSQCRKCHDNLKRQDGSDSSYHPHVRSFDDQQGHPPFRIWSQGEEKDPGTIRFNHAVHLNMDQTIVQRVGERLECQSCHRPDATGRYMQPVSFEAHCQRCHPLSIQIVGRWKEDELNRAAGDFARQPLPHPRKAQKPDIVRAALRERIVAFITGPIGKKFLNSASSIGLAPEPSRLPLPDPVQRRLEREYAWVNHHLATTETALFTGPGGCVYCHPGLTRGKDRLPVIPEANIRERWWQHAVFNHDAHRMLTCTECHQALTSKETRDVLLPGIELCLKCHNTRSSAGTARADCVLCHVYHDPKAPRATDGVSIQRLTGK